jgi:hypothetical protein
MKSRTVASPGYPRRFFAAALAKRIFPDPAEIRTLAESTNVGLPIFIRQRQTFLVQSTDKFIHPKPDFLAIESFGRSEEFIHIADC